MALTEKDGKETLAPYEPPRLLNLGGGEAYAQDTVCRAGGLPYATQCTSGQTAQGGACKQGGTASAQCRPGGTANYNCKAGTHITP